MPIAEVVALVASVAGSLAATLAERRLRRRSQALRSETAEERIERLTRSLREAAQFATEIEAEIERRQAMAARLRHDVDRYKELKRMSEEDVEAVAAVLRGELRTEGRRSLRQNVLLGIAFFLLGVAATVVVALLIR